MYSRAEVTFSHMLFYPVVMRGAKELEAFIFPLFPIQWGAKELLKVAQPSHSICCICSFIGCMTCNDDLWDVHMFEGC